MPLTLRLSRPGFDWAHCRHFLEALRSLPCVEVLADTAPATADVALNNAGHARLRALLHRADPHSLALDLQGNITPFLDSRILAMLPAARIPEHESYLRDPKGWAAAIIKMNPTSQLPGLDAFDILCVPMLDPYQQTLAPRLQRARLLRVPFAVPEWIFSTTLQEYRIHDLFFLGAVSGYYPMRLMVLEWLRQVAPIGANARSRIKFYHGQAPSLAELEAFKSNPSLFDDHQRWYAECLRHSKIMAFCPGVCGYPIQKYFEAMACGCLVVAPLPRDADLLGFRDGETMVACDHTNFRDKIEYYLDHNEERERIVANAHGLVQRNYTCTAQASILVRKLAAILEGASPESLEHGAE